jgi:hypothetical protein
LQDTFGGLLTVGLLKIPEDFKDVNEIPAHQMPDVLKDIHFDLPLL